MNALVGGALGSGDGNPVGGAAARRAAQAELRRAEYHRSPGILHRVSSWIGRLLRRLESGLSGGSAADHALLLVAVLLLAVAVGFAVRAGVPRRRAARAQSRVEDDPLAVTTASDHRRAAERFTADGLRAQALREWLRAAVATIEERGVLAPRPGRTGKATATEAGPLLPAAADDLSAAMQAFDEVWFGGRQADDADVARARAAADGVQAARIAAPVGPDADVPAGIAVPW